MKTCCTTIFFLISFVCCSFAQSRPKAIVNPYQDSIVIQAGRMIKCVLNKDNEGLIQYLFPELVKQVGGKDSMRALLKEVYVQLEKRGCEIIAARVGDPTAVIKENDELQCTIPQILGLKTGPKQKMIAKSTLIAVSSNKGKTWYFIDSRGKDIAQMRETFPNLSPKLTYPPIEPPTVYNE